MPSAVIAEADILLKHGAILLENEISLNKGILYHGWTFRLIFLLFSLFPFIFISFNLFIYLFD